MAVAYWVKFHPWGYMASLWLCPSPSIQFSFPRLFKFCLAIGPKQPFINQCYSQHTDGNSTWDPTPVSFSDSLLHNLYNLGIPITRERPLPIKGLPFLNTLKSHPGFLLCLCDIYHVLSSSPGSSTPTHTQGTEWYPFFCSLTSLSDTSGHLIPGTFDYFSALTIEMGLEKRASLLKLLMPVEDNMTSLMGLLH